MRQPNCRSLFGAIASSVFAGLSLVTLYFSDIPAIYGADPQSYRVSFASSGNDDMDAMLKSTSDLQTLRGAAPVGPFGLIERARGDLDRLKTILESYGYYRSRVAIKINGLALADDMLGDTLSALPKDSEAQVAVSFDLGPLYHLRRIDIDATLPDAILRDLGLKEGAPAIATEVLAGGNRLQAALQQQGYAFAKIDPPVAYEDREAPVLDLSFHVAVGPRVKIGQIRIVGLHRVHEKLVRARLLVHPGEQYDSAAIERARRDLLKLAVIAAVSVQLGTSVDSAGGVPITFDVRERLRHAASVNAAYSSDLGGSGGVTWIDRDALGNSEQLTLAASVINLGGSATTGVGYDTSAKLTLPDFGHRDQSLNIAVGAVQQYLQAYDQTAVTSSVTLNRKLSTLWSASIGVSTANERISQEGTINYYTMVGMPLSVSYDSTDLASPLDDPLHGMRDSLSVTPTHELGSPSATFIISQIKLAGYFDLHDLGLTDPGRSVLAVRSLAGLAQGAGEFSLPPDQRFYGGGSGTIRGYRYQAVGPQFADGNPIGGTAIIAGSLEFRQRFGANFGAALFLDGGQVSASLKPLPSVFRIGVGAGIRYYTPIGPIRVDLAVPTRRYSADDDRFEVYIGLGQAF
jgi:translocation and assembly module TamA